MQGRRQTIRRCVRQRPRAGGCLNNGISRVKRATPARSTSCVGRTRLQGSRNLKKLVYQSRDFRRLDPTKTDQPSPLFYEALPLAVLLQSQSQTRRAQPANDVLREVVQFGLERLFMLTNLPACNNVRAPAKSSNVLGSGTVATATLSMARCGKVLVVGSTGTASKPICHTGSGNSNPTKLGK